MAPSQGHYSFNHHSKTQICIYFLFLVPSQRSITEVTSLLKSSYLCLGFIRQIHVQLEKKKKKIHACSAQTSYITRSLQVKLGLHRFFTSRSKEEKKKKPHLNTAYKVWNYKLFFQWSDLAGYWLVYSPWILEAISDEYWLLQQFHIVNRCWCAAYSAMEWLPEEAHCFRLKQINPSGDEFYLFL